MATLKQALKTAKQIQPNNIEKFLFAIIKSIQKDIIDANKDQLSKGKDVYNKTIGLYSKATEAITTNQYLLGQRKDIKKAGTPFTAQETGAFFKGFYLEIVGDAFRLFSKDPKTYEILDTWESDALFGLTDNKLREIVSNDILPFLLKNIRNTLNI
ncbi:hypothetical protein MG290_01665 [Flavobacterium sp. CBA20B-1]|uniref:hypothetical protein n=1 Tax=unclassified Flavobacterium TaxID=196869 RepID=UPI00222589EE|nr:MULTISPECIES: hypothetical protein [unclassified Flavobacterium]WCM42403.1 hypothetical protein MG290_01665 [Flavobacterium sp. CBA20B-1]